MARKPAELAKREREIMNIIYRRGEATAAEVLEEMQNPPSYSAVRATMRVLEDKGHLKHHYDGNRYIYGPTVNRDKARSSALQQLLDTFFEGSAASVVATLLEQSPDTLTPEELERLSDLIDSARKEGR